MISIYYYYNIIHSLSDLEFEQRKRERDSDAIINKSSYESWSKVCSSDGIR